jgi:hypothetical protein
MTTRLAYALVLASACATTAPDPFDGLSPYEADTGGGKFDDPSCTDASYRAFMKDYLADAAAADANPCKQGNDASYRIWSYALKQELRPVIDRYSDAIDARASYGDAALVAPAGTLDDATRAAVAKLMVVKPAHAGKVGYQAWLDDLYAPAVQDATAVVGPIGITDQPLYQITPYENEWLTMVEAAAPAMVEGGSWEKWWGVVGDSFDSIHNEFPVDDIGTAWVARLAKTAPASTFDEDGAAFQAHITDDIDQDFSASVDHGALYQTALAMKPAGGGPLAFKAWASKLSDVGAVYDADQHTDLQQKAVDLIIAAKPCGAGPDVDAIAARLASLPAPLAAAATPTACMP